MQEGGGGREWGSRGGVKVRVSLAALVLSDPQPERANPCVFVRVRERECVKERCTRGRLLLIRV